MKKVVGFIGRFQPFHLGNVDAVQQILDREGDGVKIVFGVGSAQEELTDKNPFSFFEREEMIKLAMVEKFPQTSYEIFPIPDFYDAEKWVRYILRELPRMEKIYSGNIYTLKSFVDFSGEDFVVPKEELLDLRVAVKASYVRNRLGKNQDISDLVPNSVVEYLEGISASKKLREISKNFGKSFGNYAFIDAQNLHLNTARDVYNKKGELVQEAWELDLAKFRNYLGRKYKVEKAYFFMGKITAHKKLYEKIRKAGFEIIFKKTSIGENGQIKGNVDVEIAVYASGCFFDKYDKMVLVSGDGDFSCLVDYLKKQDKFAMVLGPHREKSSYLLKKSAGVFIAYLNEFRHLFSDTEKPS